MMNFKQLAKFANENDISAWRLMAAHEVDLFFDGRDLSDEAYENVCGFVYEWIIATEASAYEVVSHLYSVIEDNDDYTFDNFTEYWDEIVDTINSRI